MKKLTKVFYFNMVLFLLVGCASNTNEESITDSLEVTETDTPVNELEKSDMDDTNNNFSEERVNTEQESTLSKNNDLNVDGQEDKEVQSHFSNEQIEYARIWLQLGPNQEIDELYVRHIPAGTPLNPDDDTNVRYPEDVIQLSGSRLIDGSVTYSGNGDGTINVYKVPLRWYGGFPPPDDIDKAAVRADMHDIIENTEKVYVNIGDDHEIAKIIEKIHVDYTD